MENEQEEGQEALAKQAKVMLQRLRVSAVFRALLTLLGVFVIQFVASMLYMLVLAVIVLGIQGGTREQLTDTVVRYSDDASMIICLIYAGITILWCGRQYWRNRYCAGSRPSFSHGRLLSVGKILAALAVGFGACILLTVFLGIAAQVFPEAFTRYQMLMEQLNVGNSVFSLPYIALVGPVAEELVFRGVISDHLMPAFPFWFRNMLQAALFGVFHMNVIQGLYAFLLGLILGWIVHMTGTVLASIITHIAFNGTTILLMYLPGEESTVSGYMESVLLIAAIGCFLAGLRYYQGCSKENVQE